MLIWDEMRGNEIPDSHTVNYARDVIIDYMESLQSIVPLAYN